MKKNENQTGDVKVEKIQKLLNFFEEKERKAFEMYEKFKKLEIPTRIDKKLKKDLEKANLQSASFYLGLSVAYGVVVHELQRSLSNYENNFKRILEGG